MQLQVFWEEISAWYRSSLLRVRWWSEARGLRAKVDVWLLKISCARRLWIDNGLVFLVGWRCKVIPYTSWRMLTCSTILYQRSSRDSKLKLVWKFLPLSSKVQDRENTVADHIKIKGNFPWRDLRVNGAHCIWGCVCTNTISVSKKVKVPVRSVHVRF